MPFTQQRRSTAQKNGDQKLAYVEEILRKHGIRLDTATLKAMIDAQIKEMENTEPFCLADTKVEMIDNTKRAQRDMEFAPGKNHLYIISSLRR